MNLQTEVEIIARQHLSQGTHHRPQLPRMPRRGRRRRMAGTLRRIADRLDV